MFYSPLPTTDLYFLNSSADLVSGLARKAPVKRLGANVFRCGQRYLVIRRDEDRLIDAILADPVAELIYLIDDDLSAADDPSLPAGYQARLRAFRDGQYARLIERATLVVASSSMIADKLPAGKACRLLNPCWRGAPPDARHLDRVVAGGPLDLVHLGTGSHGAGFDFIIPVIALLLNEGADIRFHYFGNEARLGALDANARVIRHPVRRWGRYARAIGGFRFHLGLYPLPQTPFNAGRSINKILEYTLAGCPAIYSAAWARTQGLEHQKTAFLAEDSEADWHTMISTLLSERHQLTDVYRAATTLFGRLNDKAAQRRFWLETLVGAVS